VGKASHEWRVERLLCIAGTTYAEEAGIRLKDKPMPLFQLLVLCMLASKPIDATIATRAARELFRAGEQYTGDLRRLAVRSDHDTTATTRLLKQFKGIGDTGAAIFLREVQDVWGWVRPFFDERATGAARDLGLPSDPAELSALAPRANAKLAAALVRVSLDDDLRAEVSRE
jgi:hypothetical protein